MATAPPVADGPSQRQTNDKIPTDYVCLEFGSSWSAWTWSLSSVIGENSSFDLQHLKKKIGIKKRGNFPWRHFILFFLSASLLHVTWSKSTIVFSLIILLSQCKKHFPSNQHGRYCRPLSGSFSCSNTATFAVHWNSEWHVNELWGNTAILWDLLNKQPVQRKKFVSSTHVHHSWQYGIQQSYLI